jgi:hypothetical protein
MSLTTPTRNNRYQLPSWPPTEFTVDLWNAVFGDLADRITGREQLEATFETLKAQGIQASLDYIQATVAPQIVSLQQSITLAQEQINQIIIGGKAPDTLKFGGKEPSHYATAQALSEGLGGKVPTSRKINNKELTSDIELSKGDVGLDKVNNTADVDKPISTDTAQALGKRITGPNGGVVAGQIVGFADDKGNLAKGLTPEEVRVFAQVMKGGYSGRDYLMNGNRQRWLRSHTQTEGGYGSRDRWANNFYSSTLGTDRGTFAPGQTDVPGFPRYYERTNWTPGSDNLGAYAVVFQSIWDVTKLAGKRLTLTFWARASYARPLPVEFYQQFGTGGSPAGPNSFLATTFSIGTEWQRFSATFVVPSVSGKILGTNDNSQTEFILWLDGGTNFAARNGNMARMPQGWIDFAMMSLVDGDATTEILPVPWYDHDIEAKRMERYFTMMTVNMRGYLPSNNWALVSSINWPLMRRIPDVQLRGSGSLYNVSAFSLYNVAEAGCRPEAISASQGDVYVIDRSYWLNAEG